MPDRTAISKAHSSFRDRQIGPDDAARRHMLDLLGCSSLDDLIDAAVPHGAALAEQFPLYPEL